MTPVKSSALPHHAGGLPVHDWLRPLGVAFLPVFDTPFLEHVAGDLRRAFERLGHHVQPAPDDDTDVLLTSAAFGQALSWRQAPFFQARRVFGLRRQPTVFTIMHARPAAFEQAVAHFQAALSREPLDPADFAFPGLAPTAPHTLIEQGLRGGPIMALERQLQGQAMCVRILLMIGEDRPATTYHFDLVGSLARTEGDSDAFYDDVVLRIATAVAADAIGSHTVLPDTISRQAWASLAVPGQMRQASLELGRRGFFTDMVRIPDLIQVPALSGAISSQYSEGCFAAWEPALPALLTTVTGSARPIYKGNITDDDLSVVTRVREDGVGVYVRHVEGKRNDPPSSEGFEMVDMDYVLPWITIGPELGGPATVPVTRAKLHGHRGVKAYHPASVEFAPMAPAYSSYPVTCGTAAQARGIKAAFASSEALLNPEDPRQIVFTLLPTHGVFIVEKWIPGKVPFQAIWEAMDAGRLEIESGIPQGPDIYWPEQRG